MIERVGDVDIGASAQGHHTGETDTALRGPGQYPGRHGIGLRNERDRARGQLHGDGRRIEAETGRGETERVRPDQSHAAGLCRAPQALAIGGLPIGHEESGTIAPCRSRHHLLRDRDGRDEKIGRRKRRKGIHARKHGECAAIGPRADLARQQLCLGTAGDHRDPGGFKRASEQGERHGSAISVPREVSGYDSRRTG